LYLLVVNLIYGSGIGIVEGLGGPIVAAAAAISQAGLPFTRLFLYLNGQLKTRHF
jgi:hypothetical protein